ncbi:hypothetical protein HDU82_003937, partial [Entophlyctis luteolus]
MRFSPPRTFPLLAGNGIGSFGDTNAAAAMAPVTVASDGACISWDQCHVYEFLLGCSAQIPPTTLHHPHVAVAVATTESSSGWSHTGGSSSSNAIPAAGCILAADSAGTSPPACKSPTPELLRLSPTLARALTATHAPAHAHAHHPPPSSPDAIPR